MVVPEGVAASEKSAKKIVSATDALWLLAVPVTVKLKGFAEVEDNPVTVTWLDPPAEIEDALKVHTTDVLHFRMMDPVLSVLGPDAVIVNCAVLDPMGTMVERVLAESEKSGLPVPDRSSAVLAFAAFEATFTLAEVTPEPVGVKFAETVQLCPTFKVAGTVGKLIPQLFVWEKSVDTTEMLVIVTARFPLFIRRAV